MLTRSPAQPSPASTSPPNPFHTFHYATASLPRTSPCSSRPEATSLNRTKSRSSPSLSAAATTPANPSCPPPLSKRYVAVDASTQYSPMDPHAEPNAAVTSALESSHPHAHVPPTTIMTTAPEHDRSSDGQPITQPAGPAEPSSSSITATPGLGTTLGANQPVAQTLSPNKRKNSPSQHDDTRATGTDVPDRPPVPAKRAKQDTAPPATLPHQYEFCRVEDIVVLVANLLCELIEMNDALALKTGHLTRFHSRTPPGISVVDYLHRLAKHATLTPPLLLSMVYYIDLLCSAYPDFTINTLTVHRFLITAATVAAKGLSDSFWNNSTYARVGGVKVAELNLLELEFLTRVSWRIVPKAEDLVTYYQGLVKRCDGYQLADEEGAGGDGDSSSDDMDDDDASEGAVEEDTEPVHEYT